MSSDKEDRIRTRAYQIWDRQGRTDGQHEEHWAQASRELDSEDGGSPGSGDGQTYGQSPDAWRGQFGGAQVDFPEHSPAP
jgi:hypothetical protein